MPRKRKHPDAIPFEVASERLEEAAAFLASDDGAGLEVEAREYAIRYLRSVAAGTRQRRKTAQATRNLATKAAAYLERDEWLELSPDACNFAARYLRSVAAASPLGFKRGTPSKNRAREAADHVSEALLSGEADTRRAAYKIAARRMGLGDDEKGAREIQRYCSKIWGRVRPVALEKLRGWFTQNF